MERVKSDPISQHFYTQLEIVFQNFIIYKTQFNPSSTARNKHLSWNFTPVQDLFAEKWVVLDLQSPGEGDNLQLLSCTWRGEEVWSAGKHPSFSHNARSLSHGSPGLASRRREPGASKEDNRGGN